MGDIMFGMPRAPKSNAGPRSPITIRLPDKHREFLDARAARATVSRSDLVILMIEGSKAWNKPT